MSKKLLFLSQNHSGPIIAIVGAGHVDGMAEYLEKHKKLIQTIPTQFQETTNAEPKTNKDKKENKSENNQNSKNQHTLSYTFKTENENHKACSIRREKHKPDGERNHRRLCKRKGHRILYR